MYFSVSLSSFSLLLSMANTKMLRLSISHILSTILFLFRNLISYLFHDRNRSILIIKSGDAILSLYFWFFCDLRPVTVDLDDRSTVHFWTAGHRRINRPNLVMLHGYGANSKWQFVLQVLELSRNFNLYIPDLLFFGKSHTIERDRDDGFQAKCVTEGLRRLGAGRFTVYAISYGGFVAYRMAEICPEMEKAVIVSSGVGCTQEEKVAQLKSYGCDLFKILVPKSPHDLRLLVNLSSYTSLTFLKWVPDFALSQFINVMYEERRQELEEMLQDLLEREEDTNPPIISGETLLVWGDKDEVFPAHYGHQLQRRWPNSRLKIIKDAGHAVNIDAPHALNDLIISFVLGFP